MKTLNEVIKANECCDHGELDSKCEDCPYNGIGACCAERESDIFYYLKAYRNNFEALNDQIVRYQKAAKECEIILTDYVALKQYWAEQQANPALIWQELQQMIGKPVWVEGSWEIIDSCNNDCFSTDSGAMYFRKNDECYGNYGIDWQAYRKENE